MLSAGLVALLFAPVILAQEPPQTKVPGAIRSRVVLAPVDVRAIDGNGAPVTDLRQSDFTIEENGIAQTIAHFSRQVYTPESAPLVPSAPALRRGPGLETTPLTHRTFVILLGRGRLQGPSKGLDAVIEFVRTDLLPQDRVAVLAYGRATDLTTDRDSIVRLLERYRERHTPIEALLDQYFDPTGFPVSDVGVTLSASAVEKRHNTWQASVKVMVDPASIAFAEADGRHVASIDIAVFVGARSQRQVGEVRKRVDLKLEPATYRRLKQDGVSFTATIDLTAPARYVKAVVYDYAADRLGSAVAELR